jgi:hypothetical protein
MASYLQFAAPDGSAILVEVDVEETWTTRGGVVKASLKDRAHGAIAEAQDAFEAALQRAIRFNAGAMIEAIDGLDRRPDEVELAFGLKATGEAGNFAVAKAGGEANYAVKLTWKRSER